MRQEFDIASWLSTVLFVLVFPGPPASADQVKLNVALGTPAMMAEKKDTAYLKVGLTGFEMTGEKKRTPANVALVVDRSGSMQGEKIRRAKEAASVAVDRLGENDILSVVAYDDTVSVLLPATKLTDKASCQAAIERLQAGGSTALFAGVSKGAHEVRKFLDENRVNRVILLSDGLANVGPSSPSELGELGASLSREGMSVSAIGLGLGYNEDLMVELAIRSDGNHAFVENAADLERIFKKEFGDVLSVVAQDVEIRIDCSEGIRPVRTLGRKADIVGQTASARIGQLYANQEKYVLLEVEIPANPSGRTREVATVEVTYANMQTRSQDRLRSSVDVRFVDSADLVEASVNKDVEVWAIRRIADENNQKAIALRDQGQIEEARQVLSSNVSYLGSNAVKYKSETLSQDEASNREDAQNLSPEKWTRQRKEMRYENWSLY